MQDVKTQRRNAEDALGRDILEEARVQLMLKFRFLDRALWKMELEPVRAGFAYPIATDGGRILYEPDRLIARFQESGDETIRDQLHLVMHCIFRQPFDTGHKNREAWSLTCDIIVENAVMDICGLRFPSEDDPLRKEAISDFRRMAGTLAPGKLYRFIEAVVNAPEGTQHLGYGRSQLNTWHALFERDDHTAWPSNADGLSGDGQASAAGCEDEDGDESEAERLHTDNLSDVEERNAPQSTQAQIDESSADSDESDTAQEDESAQDAGMAEDAASSDEKSSEELDWEEIAKQVQMDLETFSSEFGDQAGELMASLALVNRRRLRYADFLRAFTVTNETMKVNMDEFDYIYYTYGLELYGNMPLVEPLEYQDSQQIRDFAIVIDTSESVRENLVQRFVEYTFDVLKSSENFASTVNIHVIQCDSRVQSDTVIGDLRDVDKMMDGFVVRGFGGTDFRPAFDYVEGLRKMGKLPDLKGLIYFTDGLGQFPEKAPAFDAAFVFLDEGEMLPPVPPWAIKVVLEEEELDKGEGSGTVGT